MKRIFSILMISLMWISFNLSAQNVMDVVRAVEQKNGYAYSALASILNRNGYTYATTCGGGTQHSVYVKNCKVADMDCFRAIPIITPNRKTASSSVATISTMDENEYWFTMTTYSPAIYNSWLNTLKTSKSYKLYQSDKNRREYRANGKPSIIIYADRGSYTLEIIK